MINIGLIGLGNVGEAVYTILQNNASIISERIGQDIAIKSIAVRNIKKYQAKINDTVQLTDDVMAVITDPEIDIIVEVMGGEHPAFDYITTALKNKKSVVTANKEVIAKHKSTFFKLAKENGVDIFFEAAVGGGIPIIRSLKVGFAANKASPFSNSLSPSWYASIIWDSTSVSLIVDFSITFFEHDTKNISIKKKYKKLLNDI